MSVLGVTVSMTVMSFKLFCIKVINVKCLYTIKYEYNKRKGAHMYYFLETSFPHKVIRYR